MVFPEFSRERSLQSGHPLAHETSTGPEIYRQTDGNVDAIVCGIGSSGTLTGLTHYFKKVKS